MDGARHQLLPGPGFPQDQHVRIGRSNHFHLLLNPPQSRAGAYDLLEVIFDLDIFVFDTLQPVALPEILHERDPSEGSELQYRGSKQNRDSSPIFAKSIPFHRACRLRTASLLRAPVRPGQSIPAE